MERKKGFIMVFALVIVVLIVFSVSALFFISYNDLARATTESRNMRAYYLAEAGIAKKFMQLRDADYGNTSGSYTFNDGSGTYSVAVTPATPIYTLVSTGTFKGVSRTVTLVARQAYYFVYGYLSDSEDTFYWGSPIWFVTGDVLDGDVRSNDQFNISGDPIFKGDVTSAASSIHYNSSTTNNPDFQGALILGAATVQMPAQADIINNVKNAATSTYTFTGNSVVTLLSDGTMNVKVGSGSTTNYALPTNGAMYVNGTVSVSGILDGALTIGSSNNIYVTNSVLYKADPRTDSTSNDLLCLASGSSVYVSKNAPTNVEIDSYIIAYNSFGVENYDSIAAKGTLTVYGGITQDTRGGIGTFNSSTNTKVSGYTKNYVYDSRMTAVAPTYFPPLRDSNGRIVFYKVSWSES
jgi:hypothetical protein